MGAVIRAVVFRFRFFCPSLNRLPRLRVSVPLSVDYAQTRQSTSLFLLSQAPRFRVNGSDSSLSRRTRQRRGSAPGDARLLLFFYCFLFLEMRSRVVARTGGTEPGNDRALARRGFKERAVAARRRMRRFVGFGSRRASGHASRERRGLSTSGGREGGCASVREGEAERGRFFVGGYVACVRARTFSLNPRPPRPGRDAPFYYFFFSAPACAERSFQAVPACRRAAGTNGAAQERGWVAR